LFFIDAFAFAAYCRGLALDLLPQRWRYRARASRDCERNPEHWSFIMCLAIPGKVLEEFEQRGMRMAKVQFGGIVREASLDYVPNAKVGDYVLVHVGFAISIVDAEEAARTYELLEKMDQLTELNAPVVEEVSARKRQ
jgi:hydrogenase expression/formation protein HypC